MSHVDLPNGLCWGFFLISYALHSTVYFLFISSHFCRAMLCISAAYAIMWCLSVTFVSCVKTDKHIFKIFSPSGSQAILVFPYQTVQTARQYSDGNPLTGASNAGGVGTNRDSEPISDFTVSCQRCDRGYVLSTCRRQTVTGCDTTAGSKRRCLLFTGDDGEMFMTISLNVKPKKTEQHLIVCSDKSVAYVTNNKRLHLTFYTIEAKLLTDTKHRQPLCKSRATCY